MFWLIFICSLVIIGIVTCKYWGLEIINVSGNSMYPTYKDKQKVLIHKRVFALSDLRVDKVYIYTSPKGYLVIKRLKGIQYIDGQAYLWFEGDNAHKSEDSRHYGFIEFESLEGALVFSRKQKDIGGNL